MKPTYAISFAAGTDAGNRSAKAAGRTQWSLRDFRAACRVMGKLMGSEVQHRDGDPRNNDLKNLRLKPKPKKYRP